MPAHRFACDPMLAAEFVVESAALSGMEMELTLRSRKWFTMYMRPLGLAPAGRSMLHLCKRLVLGKDQTVRRTHSGKLGSVVSYGVSKKYWNSSRM